MTLHTHALSLAAQQARTWREMTLAALDQIHELQQTVACQDVTIQRLRDELREKSRSDNSKASPDEAC